jgi:hypothetical protein
LFEFLATYGQNTNIEESETIENKNTIYREKWINKK